MTEDLTAVWMTRVDLLKIIKADNQKPAGKICGRVWGLWKELVQRAPGSQHAQRSVSEPGEGPVPWAGDILKNLGLILSVMESHWKF